MANVSYHCKECGEVAEQGIDQQGNPGVLHCPKHPRALILSVPVPDVTKPICKRCKSPRVVTITGANVHTVVATAKGYSNRVSVQDAGVGGEDGWLEFSFCLDCGQMQFNWPSPELRCEAGAML